MPSYNLVNGRPAHLSPLIDDVVRGWTAEELLVVSDAGAPGCLVDPQRHAADPVEAYAAAVRAGVDSFTQDDADAAASIGYLGEALHRGLLTESDVDRAVRHVLAVRVRLGEFDPADRQVFAVGEDIVNGPAHQLLARETAAASMVLLKHDGRVLPLDAARPLRVAVLGPLADVLHEDWYSGTLPYSVTARDGIVARLGRAAVPYAAGVDRVTLRIAADDRYVAAPEFPCGGPLTAVADPAAGCGTFEVFDWGRDIRALRATANGRHASTNTVCWSTTNPAPTAGSSARRSATWSTVTVRWPCTTSRRVPT